MRKFKLVVTTGFINATHEDEIEYDDEYLKDLSEEELEKMLQEEAMMFLHEKCECYFEEISE